VAGGVGLMLGPVLGAEPQRFTEIGVGLGVAMQLTNVLRDIAEDLDQGRCYLPADELARHGLDQAALAEAHAARRTPPALRAYVRAEVERARRLFDRADEIVALFPRDGSRLTVRLLQRTYAGILDEIARQGYDPFGGRVYVSTPRKLVILGRAVLREWPRPTLLPSERTA
jgi:phytoene synthase